ncbi:MAG: hypothetical protein ABFC77_00320 [Thermoguttaceae bacterium]
MRALSWLFCFLGGLLLLIGLGMSTSVWTGSGHVENIGLLNDRLCAVVMGAAFFVAGVTAAGFNAVLNHSLKLERKWEEWILRLTPKHEVCSPSISDDCQDQVVDHRPQEKPPAVGEDWVDQFLESAAEIHAKCPECGRAYKLKTALAGKRAVCKSCGKPITIAAS